MIVQNAAICNLCDDYIFSKHRHDFVECKCGNIFVDGGQEYLRRGGPGLNDRASYRDLAWSIEDELYNQCAEAAQEAMDTGRNKYGIANAVMRKLREGDRIVADHEPRIFAENKRLDEIMVEEADGTINRYKKVVE